MIKNSPLKIAAVAAICTSLTSCTLSPDKFFEKVVLNTNVIADFGSQKFPDRLDQETKNINVDNQENAQTIVKNQIIFIERAISNIKEVSAVGDEQKQIKDLTIELFEKVLPVYQNEYMMYAKLCDTKASDDEKVIIRQKIANEYEADVNMQFDKLYTLAKSYAETNNINVSWGY